MRGSMPKVFAWVQDLRAAFGADAIDPQIRGALQDGMPTFHAIEAGHEAGRALPVPRFEISAADMVIIPQKKDTPQNAPRR